MSVGLYMYMCLKLDDTLGVPIRNASYLLWDKVSYRAGYHQLARLAD